MAVFTNTTEEELYASVRGDLLFVRVALGDEVWGVAVEDVDVVRGDVDCTGGNQKTKRERIG